MFRGIRSLSPFIVVCALAVPATAAAKPAPVRYVGEETPKAGKGEPHAVSFTLTGTTVTKLTIGPGVAQCRPNGSPTTGAPDEPFTTMSPKLVLPKLTLGRGVARESVGLSVQANLLRDSFTAPWKRSNLNVAPNDKLALRFSIASNNAKLGSFTSVTYTLAGLSLSWPANSTGAFDAAGANVCEAIGSVTVKKRK